MQSKSKENIRLSESNISVEESSPPTPEKLFNRWYFFDEDMNESAGLSKNCSLYDNDGDIFLGLTLNSLIERAPLTQVPLVIHAIQDALINSGFFKKKKEETYCGFTPGFLIGKRF